jgi:serine/threonine protein kinase
VAADEDAVVVGQQVEYIERSGEAVIVRVVHVEQRPLEEPFFTIQFPNGGGERQTERTRLRVLSAADIAAAAAAAEAKAEKRRKMQEKLALAEMTSSGEAIEGSDVWRRYPAVQDDGAKAAYCKNSETGEIFNEVMDESGTPYYYSEETQQTVWYLPGMEPADDGSPEEDMSSMYSSADYQQVQQGGAGERYVALYEYAGNANPESDDEPELSFAAGAELIVMDSSDADWYTGYLVGTSPNERGVFPANYVQLDETQAGRASPAPMATPAAGAAAAAGAGSGGLLQVPPGKVMDFADGGLQLSDFKLGAVLGRGAYSCVKHAEYRTTKKCYAIKRIPKRIIASAEAASDKPAYLYTHTQDEKRLMAYMDSPFLAELHGTFQDSENLYFVLEYVPGGELAAKTAQGQVPIKVNARATEGKPAGFSAEAQFYHAEIVLALEWLHARGIVYRDLKLSNVLLDATGHVKLVDFGCAKHLGQQPGERTYTACGTPKYMAPEVIQGQGYGVEADVWSLGVCLYYMLENKYPFEPAGKHRNNPEKIFTKILKQEAPLFTAAGQGKPVVAKQTQEYICGLLTKDARSRLGCSGTFGGISELKTQPFYDGVAWEELEKRSGSAVPEGRAPAVTDEYDVSNYVEFKFEAKSEEKHKAIAAKEDFDAQLPEAEQAVLAAAAESWQAEELEHARALYDHGDYIRAMDCMNVATCKIDRQSLPGARLVATRSFKGAFDGF